MANILRDETGSLTLEWIFLFTLLVLGIAGGVASVRNSLILETAEDAGAAASLNTNYSVSAPPTLSIDSRPSAIINGFENEATPDSVSIEGN